MMKREGDVDGYESERVGDSNTCEKIFSQIDIK